MPDRVGWSDTRWRGVGCEGGGEALTLLLLRDTLQPASDRETSVRIRFGSPFSSKIVGCGHCLVT